MAAGNVDVVALATPPDQAAYFASACAERGVFVGLHCRRWLRPGLDARAAWLCRARSVCPAHAAAWHQCRGGLVLGILLQHRCAGHLGHLRRDGDRHAAAHRGQRGQAGARLFVVVLDPALARRHGGNVRLVRVGALAHRPPSARTVEEPGAAGWRRRTGLAAADDAVVAAARLRAQQPPLGRTPGTPYTQGGRLCCRAGVSTYGGGCVGAIRPLEGRGTPCCSRTLRRDVASGTPRPTRGHGPRRLGGRRAHPAPHRSR
jgi:hypothetical protein